MVKIVLLGDGAVGKTTLRNTFMGEGFTGEYLMTIGADFSTKQVAVNVAGTKYEILFQIWDLAGQKRFGSIRSLYYSGASGVLLVYDITRPETYENTIHWLIEVTKNIDVKVPPPVILLANKIDLREDYPDALTTKEEDILAGILPKYYDKNIVKIPYYETSAKIGTNVELAFQKLGELIIKRGLKIS